MNGQPVWLVSMSLDRPDGRKLPVPRWPSGYRLEAPTRMREVLGGCGDEARERLFRMNVTMCLHRAATDAEVRTQPEWFLSAPGCGLAGGPVEVLWENVPGAASTKPCRAPRKHVLDRSDALMWLPVDCGKCPPCRARARFQP